jgi:hypothetical protein
MLCMSIQQTLKKEIEESKRSDNKTILTSAEK